MQIKFVSDNQIKSQIHAAVSKHIDLANYQLFLFGSRVRGDCMERVDIDLGIEGKIALTPRLKLAIEDELEKIPTLYKFDFVDFASVPTSFKNEAKKSIEIIS